MNALVMEGPLRDGDLDLPTVLQAVSLSRQYTVVRLQDVHRRPMGEIRLKAGRVVTATIGSERGREAFFRLLREPSAYFQVERHQDPIELPEPVGTVVSLLLQSSKVPRLRPVATPPSIAPSVARNEAPPVVAPPRLPTPKPRAVPTLDAAIGEIARQAVGLQALIVIGRADGLSCGSWSTGAVVDVEAWSAFLAQTERAAKICLDLDLRVDDGSAFTWESERSVLVLRALDRERAVVFVFDRSVTLGYARLQIRKMLPPLARTPA